LGAKVKILWGRILIAAVGLEVLYGLLLVFLLGDAEIAYTAAGIATVFVFMMFGGLGVGRKAASRPVLQATLVGVIAVLFYTVLTVPAVVSGELLITVPLLLNHAAKILGAGFGGWLATVMRARKQPAEG
jgi:hypothetical protein